MARCRRWNKTLQHKCRYFLHLRPMSKANFSVSRKIRLSLCGHGKIVATRRQLHGSTPHKSHTCLQTILQNHCRGCVYQDRMSGNACNSLPIVRFFPPQIRHDAGLIRGPSCIILTAPLTRSCLGLCQHIHLIHCCRALTGLP